jgi:hypothetical protein
MRTSTSFLLTICVAFFLCTFASGQEPVTFNQIAKLTAPDGAASDQFGYSVAISGNTIVVGKNSGSVQSAFVYQDNSGTVTQVAELTPSDGVPGDRFGSSVAISGNTIAIAAAEHQNHDPINTGSIYVFIEPAGGWTDMTETAELNPGQAGAEIGRSIGATANEVVSTTNNGACRLERACRRMGEQFETQCRVARWRSQRPSGAVERCYQRQRHRGGIPGSVL